MAAARLRAPTPAARMILSCFEMVLNRRVIALDGPARFRLPDHRRARRPLRKPGPTIRAGSLRVFIAALPL